MQALYLSKNGPLPIAVDAQSHWQTYKGGIVSNCKGKSLDHGQGEGAKIEVNGFDWNWIGCASSEARIENEPIGIGKEIELEISQIGENAGWIEFGLGVSGAHRVDWKSVSLCVFETIPR